MFSRNAGDDAPGVEHLLVPDLRDSKLIALAAPFPEITGTVSGLTGEILQGRKEVYGAGTRTLGISPTFEAALDDCLQQAVYQYIFSGLAVIEMREQPDGGFLPRPTDASNVRLQYDPYQREWRALSCSTTGLAGMSEAQRAIWKERRGTDANGETPAPISFYLVVGGGPRSPTPNGLASPLIGALPHIRLLRQYLAWCGQHTVLTPREIVVTPAAAPVAPFTAGAPGTTDYVLDQYNVYTLGRNAAAYEIAEAVQRDMAAAKYAFEEASRVARAEAERALRVDKDITPIQTAPPPQVYRLPPDSAHSVLNRDRPMPFDREYVAYLQSVIRESLFASGESTSSVRHAVGLEVLRRQQLQARAPLSHFLQQVFAAIVNAAMWHCPRDRLEMLLLMEANPQLDTAAARIEAGRGPRTDDELTLVQQNLTRAGYTSGLERASSGARPLFEPDSVLATLRVTLTPGGLRNPDIIMQLYRDGLISERDYLGEMATSAGLPEAVARRLILPSRLQSRIVSLRGRVQIAQNTATLRAIAEGRIDPATGGLLDGEAGNATAAQEPATPDDDATPTPKRQRRSSPGGNSE